MVFKMKQFWLALRVYKQGLFVGALTGAVAAYYVTTQGFDLTTLASAGKGLVDSVFARQTALTVASYKLYGTFIFLGAAVGMLSEYVVDRYNLGRIFKRLR